MCVSCAVLCHPVSLCVCVPCRPVSPCVVLCRPVLSHVVLRRPVSSRVVTCCPVSFGVVPCYHMSSCVVLCRPMLSCVFLCRSVCALCGPVLRRPLLSLLACPAAHSVSWGVLGAFRGPSWGHLGLCGAILERLEASWGRSGRSRGFLGPSRGNLRAFWGVLGRLDEVLDQLCWGES